MLINMRRRSFFLENEDRIHAFVANLKYLFQGDLYFDMPRELHQRRTRHNKRVRMEGTLVLGRSGGITATARLYDFSSTGIGFLTEDIYTIGESLFLSLEIPNCGVCETVATVVRIDDRLRKGTLVAVKMTLSKTQKVKAEQLYLCKKAEALQKRAESSKSLYSGRIF